jgi:methyl-accepting chemotaxis protein
MLEVTAMSKRIESACAAQAEGSLQISAAVVEIHEDADRCLQAAAHLEMVATQLIGQVDLLQQETGAFKL